MACCIDAKSRTERVARETSGVAALMQSHVLNV